jgi:hypothetical protein
VHVVIFQATDYNIYKSLRKQDWGDLGEDSIPPLQLLDYLKTTKKNNPGEIPFVKLDELCVPEWHR